jgi:hypothetical protein
MPPQNSCRTAALGCGRRRIAEALSVEEWPFKPRTSVRGERSELVRRTRWEIPFLAPAARAQRSGAT